MTRFEPGYEGPFPDGVDALARAATAYATEAADPAIQDRPTICEPWTVEDLTRHLAASFQRFNEMLARSRAGDFTPPFAPRDLDDENLRAVVAFEGEPLPRFEQEVTTFLDAVGDPAEPMAHQRGVIPVGLQVLFGLADVAIHHWDLTMAAARTPHRPDDDVPALIVPAFGVLGADVSAGEPAGDVWTWVLRRSGRDPMG